ncbi:MAG: MFS transporter [Thermoplasmata archaeon]|nr:MFS transporter [Thermoplasmata archaeon]
MRTYRRSYLVAALMFNLINGAAIVVFPLYMLKLSEDYLMATLVTGLPLSAQIAGNYFWGRISDKLRTRKLPAVSGCIAGSVLFLLLPFLSPVQFIGLRTVQNMLLSSQVLLQNLASDTEARKGSSLGILNLYSNIGVVAGALGFVFLLPSETLSFEFIAAFSVSLALAGIVGTLSLVFSADVPFNARRKKTKNRTVYILCLLTAVVMWGNYTVFSIFPVYISDFSVTVNGLTFTGVKLTGIFIASSSITGIPASYIAGKFADKYRKELLIGASILVYSVIWYILAFTTSLPVIYIIWVLPVWLFFVLPVTAAASESVGIEERGWAIGLINAGIGMGALLGSYTGGYLSGLYGFPSAFMVAGCTVLLGLVPLALWKSSSTKMYCCT